MNEMDEFAQGYQEEDYSGPRLEEGDYMAKIQNITFKPSSKGDPMITIDLVIRESTIIFKHRIVKNDYFNSNMTKFYDCFKIPRGNFEYQRWLNRNGKVHIAKGKPNDAGMAYMEIKYLIVDAPKAGPAAQSAPAQAAPAPRQQYQAQAREPVAVGAASQFDPMPFTDDIPF